jgi:hypothetical protein
MNKSPLWPEGKHFAFTVFDDTDRSTIENVPRVYGLLQDLGLQTTKSVWLAHSNGTAHAPGTTCADPVYRRWVLGLQAAGFEIGYHNASYASSTREQTIAALEDFRNVFGAYPKCMANHWGCAEAIYWRHYRLSGWRSLLYKAVQPRSDGESRGHIEGDHYFWGDHCKEKIKYVRNFVFAQTDTLRACPYMPYHDPARPYVRYWYAASDGGQVNSFNRRLGEENQDRLEEEGGACIMYTHFANGFQEGDHVHGRFAELIRRMSRKNGWFVPVSTLLDYLLEQRPNPTITSAQRGRLERSWLREKLLVGTT